MILNKIERDWGRLNRIEHNWLRQTETDETGWDGLRLDWRRSIEIKWDSIRLIKIRDSRLNKRLNETESHEKVTSRSIKFCSHLKMSQSHPHVHCSCMCSNLSSTKNHGLVPSSMLSIRYNFKFSLGNQWSAHCTHTHMNYCLKTWRFFLSI